MKYLKQLCIIIIISLAGEMLKFLLPFPIPASIYGLGLMFIMLLSGVLKLSQVENVADFLAEIMPIMFVPSAVGLITSWGILKDMLVPVILSVSVVTVFVMVVTGKVCEKLMSKTEVK